MVRMGRLWLAFLYWGTVSGESHGFTGDCVQSLSADLEDGYVMAGLLILGYSQ